MSLDIRQLLSVDKGGENTLKIFHLSDLHIGLRLLNRDFREDQEYVLDQIVVAAGEEKPDAVVIAGDIYDKPVPSGEAVEVFNRFIQGLREASPRSEIMAISGNHDSGLRLNLFREILKSQKIHMIGLPPQTPGEYVEKVVLEDEFGKVNFYLLPFVRPSMVKSIVGTDEKGNSLSYDQTIRRLLEREAVEERERNVLVSHQFYLPVGTEADQVERMDSEIQTVGNIDQVGGDVLEKFDYGALGHIHKPMKVGDDRFRYCGTPLACSVSEAGQQKGILFTELREKGQVHTKVIPISPLRQIRIIRGSVEEALLQAGRDYVVVVLTGQEKKGMLDVYSRLRHAFPNLLEIRRETVWQADYRELLPEEAQGMDPFSLCCSFLKELDQEDKALLQDVINTAREVI